MTAQKIYHQGGRRPTCPQGGVEGSISIRQLHLCIVTDGTAGFWGSAGDSLLVLGRGALTEKGGDNEEHRIQS